MIQAASDQLCVAWLKGLACLSTYVISCGIGKQVQCNAGQYMAGQGRAEQGRLSTLQLSKN